MLSVRLPKGMHLERRYKIRQKVIPMVMSLKLTLWCILVNGRARKAGVTVNLLENTYI